MTVLERPGWRERAVGSFERRYWPYFLLAPSLLLVGIVVIYPLVSGMVLSLQDAELLRPEKAGFVGLRNYNDLVGDPTIWISIVNTATWVIGGVTVQAVAGLALALVLNGSYRGVGIARTLVLLPWFLPSVVVAHMWTMMLDARFGVINDLLVRVGALPEYKAWFADPHTALLAAMVVEAWYSAPFFALFLLAAMQGIPGELTDAARVDGATGTQLVRYLVLPLIRPVIVVATVLQVIYLVNSPTLLQILTGGGPGKASMVLSLYAFLQAYQSFDFGYAAAISVLLLFVLSVFAVVYFKVSRVATS